MKNGILVIGLSLLCITMQAQTGSVNAYLVKYKNFVESLEKMKTINNDEYLILDSTYEALTDEYHDMYKVKMTNSQISTYMQYRTKYKKLLTVRRTAVLSNSLDTVGNTVKKAVRRTGSKVSGFIKGVIKK